MHHRTTSLAALGWLLFACPAASGQARFDGLAGEGTLALAGEDVQIRCERDAGCTLTDRVRFENDSRREGRLDLRLPGGLDPVAGVRLEPNPGCELDGPAPGRVILRAQPLRACTLVVRAALTAERREVGTLGPGALGGRVFDFARTGAITEDVLQLATAVVPRRPGAQFELRVDHPPGVRVSFQICPASGAGSSTWTPELGHPPPAGLRGQGGPMTELLRSDGAAPASIQLRLRTEPRPNPWLADAGPFIGAGVQMQWVEDRVLGQRSLLMLPAARLGFEWAPLDFLNTSLALETDFRRRLVVTPVVEGGLPLLFGPRVVAVGVGAPISALPKAQAGVRFRLRLNLLFVSVVHAIDWVPGLPRDHPDHLVVSIAVQLGL